MKVKAEAKTEEIPKYIPNKYIDNQILILEQTTNVFVANLPTHVTEPVLGNFFARCGPIGSVSSPNFTHHSLIQ